MENVIQQSTIEQTSSINDFFKNAIISEVELEDGSITKIVTLSNLDFSGLEALNLGERCGLSELPGIKRVRSFFGTLNHGSFKQSISMGWTDIKFRYSK